MTFTGAMSYADVVLDRPGLALLVTEHHIEDEHYLVMALTQA